jgi:hypothetical protein
MFYLNSIVFIDGIKSMKIYLMFYEKLLYGVFIATLQCIN